MEILLWVIAIVLVCAGIAGIILPAIPSTPLVFIGLFIGAWVDDFERVGVFALIIIGLLFVLSMVVDFVASGLGAQKTGSSKIAAFGAIAGSLIGLFFGLWGLVLGPFIGAFAGELLARKDMIQAGKAGLGAIFGLVIGVATKAATTGAMIGVFLFAYFF
ncbi:MAG: hypothetical protein CL946_07930 [Ectothiorhodospiraceae bacterium]|nr:hypothetical protein [Ectothiorhodospiraceae bacterium]